MPDERLQPQNIEVERAVLGAMMLDSDALDKAIEILDEDCFYTEGHKRIFIAMRGLTEADNPVDFITVSEELSKTGQLEKVGGRSYISSLLSDVVTAGNIEYHANIIKEKAILRNLIHIGSDMVSMAFDESLGVEELLDEAERKIFRITERSMKGDFTPLSSMLNTTYEHIEELHRGKHTVNGLPSGFPDLDEQTTGFNRAEYIIIAARPSVGKTSLALTIALNVAEKGYGVAIFSMEMASEQLVIRLIADKCRVNSHQLRKGNIGSNELKKISVQLGYLAAAKIFIDDTADQTVLKMRAKLRRLMRRQKIDLVVVDYLQLITTGQSRVESRQQEITTISRQLKSLAREFDIPILVLSQLSRQVEGREEKRPILADLRESGAIEQDADSVMFIYRPELYFKRSKDDVDLENKLITIPDKKVSVPIKDYAEIIIAKQRNGPTGSVHLLFHKEYTSFESYAWDKLDESQENWNNGLGGT